MLTAVDGYGRTHRVSFTSVFERGEFDINLRWRTAGKPNVKEFKAPQTLSSFEHADGPHVLWNRADQFVQQWMGSNSDV